MPGMVRLPAVPAMMLDGFVELMICLADSLLTMIVIGVSSRRRRESQQANQRCGGKHRASQKLLLSRVLEHGFSILLVPRLGWGGAFGPCLLNTVEGRM